jgi:uncharacterized protein (DUF924 family)
MNFSERMTEAILTFWFEELEPAQWWRVDAALDATIRVRFGDFHRHAAAGELSVWRDTPVGRLAEIIILDQFSRNLFRGTPQAFACDAMALALAQEAVRARADAALDASRRGFFYMPYMHSESAVIHFDAAPLFAAPGLEHHAKSALQHKAIIDRFGRYPHRNAMLGRVSSAAEVAFLLEPNSSF